jgi:hypothetical protein
VNASGVWVANAVTLNLTATIELDLSASVVADNKVSLQLTIAGHQTSFALIQSKIGSVNLQVCYDCFADFVQRFGFFFFF